MLNRLINTNSNKSSISSLLVIVFLFILILLTYLLVNDYYTSVAQAKLIDQSLNERIAGIQAMTLRNIVTCLIGLTVAILFILPHVRKMRQEEEQVKATLQKRQKEVEHLSAQLDAQEQQLKSAAAKLEERSSEVSNFARMASHDLKAPMRSIYSFAQLLKRRQGSSADESTLEYLNFIIDSAARATDLINSLSTYSAVEKSLEDKKQFSLNRSVLLAQQNLYAEISAKKADIHSEELPEIIANPTLISQVFQNLISNAIKYNESNPPIVEIRCQINDSNEYCFYVRDNGIGIPADFQQKVFTVFTRLHSVKDYEGAGIGLAFCKRVITSYDGNIWLESTEGEGTTIFFTLPESMVVKAPAAKEAILA